MTELLKPAVLTCLLFSGAIFGFFYAWVCSTMWGLDTLDPQIAIQAMNAMNQSVRNTVFFAGFMGTPVVLLASAVLAWFAGHRPTAAYLAVACAVYVLGAFVPTRLVNVEMNIALASVSLPETREQAQAIWAAYSPKWQFYNQLRTGFSGISLILVGLAVLRLR